MFELVLAVLSISAASGIRIAMPLLVIGMLYGTDSWSKFPIVSAVQPPVLICILVSWSLLELFASKRLLGQRVLQLVQLILSPIAGTIAGIALAQGTQLPGWVAGCLGGGLALVLQLVQVGWFYRLRGLPLWMIFMQDLLCVTLVLLAFDSPKQGGLIAMILLWLAIRSSNTWRSLYQSRSRAALQPD